MIGCTDTIAAAIRRELEQRRHLLEAATDLGELVIRVRLQAGTPWIRALVWEEERVYRKSGPVQKQASDQLRT